jgi:hypothetical protein
MKKYIFNPKLFVLIAIVFVASCTNLEVSEKDSEVIGGSGATTQFDLSQLLSSSYQQLDAFTDQANIYSLFNHTSDEMIPPTRGVDWGDNGVWRTLHTHNWDPTHEFVLNSWNQLNARIFTTVQIISGTPKAGTLALTPQQLAEAKFLRAFYMWYVMDLYGKVPYRELGEGVDVNPKVLTRQEAFDFIVADLTAALPNLPNTGPSATNSKATKAAANALLARLHLNKAVYSQSLESAAGPYTFASADMQKVIDYATAVESAGYSLESDYFTNFTTSASSEIIFTSATGTPQNRYFMTLHYDQKPNGWNGFTTLSEFYAKFENGDERRSAPSPRTIGQEFHGLNKGFLVGEQKDDNGVTIKNSRQGNAPLVYTPEIPLSGATTANGIRVIKYHPADKGQYILLRYADVYLMRAEAHFRKGETAQAKAIVDALRANRGASTLATLTEANILDERGRELYWEGIRRVDQVRFGTFDDTWHEKTKTDATRVLFPIPQQALDSNPNLTQNPGY